MSPFVCLLSACAVSAMLCEVVAASGVSSRVKSSGADGEKVKGDIDFDVVLCQSELMERALQLCHLLPPGFLPVSLNSYHTSHSQLCVSLSGCLIELNSHSSCSATPVFGRERGQIFVCAFHLFVSVSWNLECTLHKTYFPGPRLLPRVAVSFPFCPTFVLTTAFFVSIARGYVSYPILSLKKNTNTCSYSCWRSLILLHGGLVHHYNTPYGCSQQSS